MDITSASASKECDQSLVWVKEIPCHKVLKSTLLLTRYPESVENLFHNTIVNKASKKLEGKAYILLSACSLTRAVHLALRTDQTTEGISKCLKRFIARRGRPTKIYSDNGKSLVSTSKWLKRIMEDEKTQDYLAHHNILWQFNLAKAPWWGG